MNVGGQSAINMRVYPPINKRTSKATAIEKLRLSTETSVSVPIHYKALLAIGVTVKKKTARPQCLIRAHLGGRRSIIKLKIDRPGQLGRQQVLYIQTSKLRENRTTNSEVDLKAIKQWTDSLSDAELIGLVNSRKKRALNQYRPPTSANCSSSV